MRKVIVFALALLSVLPVLAFAHPGNTDSKGGHHVTATGEYHYHHGQPAHQHPNGECPYDYVDKTGSSSGSSSGTTKSNPTVSASKNSKESSGFVFEKELAALWGAILFVFACHKTSLKISDHLQKKAARKQEKILQEKRKEEYRGKYAYLTRNQIAFMHDMPRNTEIGDDNLPYKTGAKSDWGNGYTVYICPSGTVYHKTPNCRAIKSYYTKAHLANVQQRKPCGLCKPDKEDISWYAGYQKIIKEIEQFSIPIKK